MMTRQMFGIPTMAFEENPAEAATNHFVVLPKNAPMTVSVKIEPSLGRLVDALDYRLQLIARFAWSLFSNTVDTLFVALLAGKAKLASKGIAQERETCHPRIHNVCLLGM